MPPTSPDAWASSPPWAWRKTRIALNADLIDERAFLDQTYLLDDERQAMFFHALDKTPKGLAACVFDSPDRIQHMFFRTLDPDHPANQGREVRRLG